MKKLIPLFLLLFALSVSFGFGVAWWASGIDYRLRNVVIAYGSEVTPYDFLANAEVNGGISASFLRGVSNPPAVGVYRVQLLLRQGIRSTEAWANLVVLDLHGFELELEYPHVEVWRAFFVQNLAQSGIFGVIDIMFAHDPNAYYVMLDQVGTHPVELLINGEVFVAYVNIVDTTPPVAITRDITITPGEELLASDFLASVFDLSPIGSVEFLYHPDLLATGYQTVSIVVADIWGNEAIFQAELTILGNDLPPVIIGTVDMEVMIGRPLMFRQGVSAYDAFGRPIEFSIDNSAVDPGTPGAYSVVYYAVDAWGNRAEERIVLHILSIDPEYVYARVDVILEQILHDGMTQVEQARAIYDWVRNNIRFTSDIRRDSAYEAAYAALTRRSGNCFVFFGISHVMLTRAGIPSLRIDRVPGVAATNHRWNLINPDGLGWHHFDSLPPAMPLDTFMFTSSEAREFTRLLNERFGRINYYYYDPSLYPEIVQ